MLQLNQLGNPEDEKNMHDIYYWAQLFKAGTWEEIKMLADKNQAIQESIVTIQELTADEKMQMQMEARERYRRDYEAAIEFGRQQVLKQLAQKDEQLSQQNEQLAQKDERIRFLEEQVAKLTKQSN